MPTCKHSVSLQSGTFLEKSRLSLNQWLVLFYWWIREYPVTDAAEEVGNGEGECCSGISVLHGHLQLETAPS